MSVASTSQTLLDKWLHHADNYDLPFENIPVKLRAGESGASYGWPQLMMGDSTLTMLHGQQITKTSQCIQLAGCMTEEQFRQVCGGGRPSWGYLKRCVESNSKNMQDYLSRKRFWEADQCIINTRILTNLKRQLNGSEVVCIGGHNLRQLDVVNAAIADNEARLKRC